MEAVIRPRVADQAGFSLIELLVAMALTVMIMSATLAGLSDIMKSNQLVLDTAQMNNHLRTGADLMIRDFLQAGSGLPSSKTVMIPFGTGSSQVRLPGPLQPTPSSPATWLAPVGTQSISAVLPRPGAGPVINGTNTDVVTVLMADNTFVDVRLSAVTNTTATVCGPADTTTCTGWPFTPAATHPDRVARGQLMMLSKGSVNTLVQVTDVNQTTRVINFDNGDSLNLNQSAAIEGSLRNLNGEDPVDDASTTGVNEAAQATRISRMRMITYYLDTTNPTRPRLMRRVNNGHWQTFNNNLGTAVATDVYDLQFTYDISNGAPPPTGNPGGVEMTAADLGGSGRCSPNPCATTQIRKINLRLTTRTMNQVSGQNRFMSNTLDSQVSLRAMAFVDRYR